MVDINPVLKIISAIKMGLKSNNSLRSTLRDYFESQKRTSFEIDLEKYLLDVELGSTREVSELGWNEYRSSLVSLLLRGLNGEPIWDALLELESEVHNAVITELEEFNGSLPVKLIIPMILVIFPALVILTVGPLILELLESLQS